MILYRSAVLFTLLLMYFSPRAQEIALKDFDINKECYFTMPENTVFKDTIIIGNDGSGFRMKIYEFTSGDFILQAVRTEFSKDEKLSEIQEKQVMVGMKNEMIGKAGEFPVVFTDTAIGGIRCIRSVTVAKKLRIITYFLVLRSAVYTFSSSFPHNASANQQSAEKFFKSIRFRKDEMQSREDNSGYRIGEAIGKIIGYLIIPALISLIFFFRKRKQNLG